MKPIFYFYAILYMLTGCASQKKITYLQDIPEEYRAKMMQSNSDAILLPNDRISILVNSRDVELAQMFNLPVVSYPINSNGNYSTGQNRISGYLVNNKGNIDFPQLGVIKAQGLTLTELTDTIKRQIIQKGMINDPVVTVQFMNFKISVIGEVNKPGNFDIPDGRVTIFDALSRAGDLTIYGKRENVKVIREMKGERNVVTVDLRSKDIFNSPYYYLQQNDIVYVEPNKAKAGQREINQNRTIGTFASIMSVLVSLSVLIFK